MDHKEGAYKVRDLALADAGRRKIEWAESRMPVLAQLREQYRDRKPFRGYRIVGCLHVTKETAVLVETFKNCGAEVAWSGCNPLSTNDEVAAALAKNGIEIYAWYGQSVEDFYWSIERTIDNPLGNGLFTADHDMVHELGEGDIAVLGVGQYFAFGDNSSSWHGLLLSSG